MIRLVKTLFSIPRLWSAMKKIEDAWDLSSQGKDQEAEKVFCEGEKMLKRLPYQQKIMKAYIQFKLEKREESADLFKSALLEINGDKELTVADALYLKSYISGPLKVYRQFNIGNINSAMLVDLKDVQLDEVSNILKSKFPCRDHPDWPSQSMRS